MKPSFIALLLLAVSLSFAVGVAQDYPSQPQLHPNGTMVYGVRVYNTLNETVSVSISRVAGTGFAQLNDPQPSYVIAPKGRLELFFNLTAPTKPGVYFDKFKVTETKPDDPGAMIDTAISPEFTIGVEVTEIIIPKPPEPVLNATNATNATTPEPSTNPFRAEGVSLTAVFAGLLGLLLVSLIIYLASRRKKKKQEAKRA